MTDNKAIMNLSSHGYGIVRKVNQQAVRFQTNYGNVTMSNACFERFLETLDTPKDL